MMRMLQIRPLDPIVVRDGRPFGETPGARAHSMDEITPSVVAGTIRTLLGKYLSDASHNDIVFQSKTMEWITKLVVRGPLYEWGGKLYFPVPKDMEIYEVNGRLQAGIKRPVRISHEQGFLGTGKTGQYEDILWPVSIRHEGKPSPHAPAYISADWMIKWLGDSLPLNDWSQTLDNWHKYYRELHSQTNVHPVDLPFMPSFVRDIRTHTAIDSSTHKAKDQALFTTEALVLPEGMSLLTGVEWPEDNIEWRWPEHLSAVHSFGGKRRLAHFSEVKHEDLWRCPDDILSRVDGARFIRMVLITPAYFSKGWKPGWLDNELQTTEEFHPEVRLQLRWACVPRWQPISGWSYAIRKAKAVRRMAPAGSVYFFEVKSGNPLQLVEQLWLQSVSDPNRRKGALDREDGFGLAVWGIWSPQ